MSATGATKLLDFTAITSDQTSADWELPEGATGGIFVFRLTASSGATGGTLRIEGKDETSGTYYQINVTPVAVKTAITTVHVVYPSGSASAVGGDITAFTNYMPLPPKGRVRFLVTDGTHTGTVSLTPIVL